MTGETPSRVLEAMKVLLVKARSAMTAVGTCVGASGSSLSAVSSSRCGFVSSDELNYAAGRTLNGAYGVLMAFTDRKSTPRGRWRVSVCSAGPAALLALSFTAGGELGWAPTADAYAKTTLTFTPRWPTTTALGEAAEDGERVGAFAATRPLTGAPTVLPIIDADYSHAAIHGSPALFYRLRLPNRAEFPRAGQTGWVAADAGTVARTPWRVTVDLSRRRARIIRNGVAVRSYPVVIGASATPTPAGRFFITEIVRPPRARASVLATSAYVNIHQEFGSRFGEVGLLRRAGRRATRGSVGFDDAAVTWMASRLTAGTPVSVLP